jgi:hypothetical protein
MSHLGRHIGQHNWKKLAHSILSTTATSKDRPSLVKQMMTQFYMQELKEETLLKDF